MTEKPIYFPGIRADERIELQIFKHWIVYVKIFARLFLTGVLLPFAGFWFLLQLLDPGNIRTFSFLVITLVMLWSWLTAYLRWIDDQFDCLLITSQRVIDVTQDGIFRLAISETNLGHIQDVQGVIAGILGNVLTYGNLEVQTAADKITFQMDHVDDPHQIAQLILNQRRSYLASKNAVEPDPIAENRLVE